MAKRFLKVFNRLVSITELEKQKAIWKAFGVDYEEQTKRAEEEWLRLKVELEGRGISVRPE